MLPAILLHDCGYFLVPEEDHLKGLAGAPIGWEADVTRRHEIEGARLAGEILGRVGYDRRRTELVQEIVDGHDSRAEALSLEDALVKDADKALALHRERRAHLPRVDGPHARGVHGLRRVAHRRLDAHRGRAASSRASCWRSSRCASW